MVMGPSPCPDVDGCIEDFADWADRITLRSQPRRPHSSSLFSGEPGAVHSVMTWVDADRPTHRRGCKGSPQWLSTTEDLTQASRRAKAAFPNGRHRRQVESYRNPAVGGRQARVAS